MRWLAGRRKTPDKNPRLSPNLEGWKAYIEQEVAAVCDARGWGHQIRRCWGVREKPVDESPIADLEWKIIPDPEGERPAQSSSGYEGRYYLLRLDLARTRFLFQHDTHHCGVMGRHFARETYTEISFQDGLFGYGYVKRDARHMEALREGPDHNQVDLPPVGWLRDHLLDLTKQFQPNFFSIT